MTCTTTKELETCNGLVLSLGKLKGYQMKIQMNNTPRVRKFVIAVTFNSNNVIKCITFDYHSSFTILAYINLFFVLPNFWKIINHLCWSFNKIKSSIVWFWIIDLL